MKQKPATRCPSTQITENGSLGGTIHSFNRGNLNSKDEGSSRLPLKCRVSC